MSVPTIMLNDGREIPQLGFGVFQIDPSETAQAVKTALDLGYRHLDTAQMYGNEAETLQGVLDSGVPREEVWITSKLNNGFHEPDKARTAIDDSVDKLGGPIDLYLIHWPLPTLYGGDFVSTWKVLEEARADGRLKSIGVSNFQVNHLQRLAQETTVVPAVNQIEVHPYFGNEEVRRYCGEHQIGVEAWSPIAQGKVLDDPTITDVARRLGKSPAQVVLRWHVERGDIVFPKSVTPSRMEENFALFDFELAEEDLALISALDQGGAGRTGGDPDTMDYVPS